MKRLIIFLFLFSIIGISDLLSQNTVDKQAIAGSWLGKLDVGAISLRVVFNLSSAGTDSLAATFDSPDQGAKNIKIGPVTINGQEIKIMALPLMAEYNGTIKNDTLIEGTFKQAGQVIPLNISKLKKAFTLNRPQEPKPPFPYISEDVKFRNEKAGIELAGTLTIPEGNGPFPAVILITGSGSQNRNEELMGHKPFWVIADHLTRNGIAVLRYDDRGVGSSQGSPVNVTSFDFAYDAESAFQFLKSKNKINPKLIGLAGHSEGGFIAPIVASSNQGIAFVISLAGTGVKGEDILNKQNMDISIASGAKLKQVKESVKINKKLFAVLKKEKDNKKAEAGMSETYRQYLIRQKKSPAEIDKEVKQLNASMNPVSYNWLRYFISTDPAVFWRKVKCPVLALNGKKDLQVAADLNLPAIEKSVKAGGNKNVRIVALPGLNHLFQHCKTGLPTEYGEIEETISPEVLNIMSDWINSIQK